jgi:hypothetical protein
MRIEAGWSFVDVWADEDALNHMWAHISALVVSSTLPNEVCWIATALVVAEVAAVQVFRLESSYLWEGLRVPHRPNVHQVIALQCSIPRAIELELAVSRALPGQLALPTLGNCG